MRTTKCTPQITYEAVTIARFANAGVTNNIEEFVSYPSVVIAGERDEWHNELRRGSLQPCPELRNQRSFS